MVLHQENEEQNQHIWRSRVARERRGLSVSVEETLEDGLSDEFKWDEDERGSTNFTRSAYDASIVPPRFSLQSRTIEAIQSECIAAADATPYAVFSAGEVGERKPNITAHNSNILLRFAQRLTSSLGSFNATTDSSHSGEYMSGSATLEPAARELSRSLKASSLSSIADIEVCTASTMTGPLPRDMRKSSSAYPTSRDPHGRQRLAGRSTRIRLEVVPGVASQKAKECPLVASHDDLLVAETREDFRPLEAHPVEANTTGIHLAAISPLREETGSTSVHLPTIQKTSPAEIGTIQSDFPIDKNAATESAQQQPAILNGTLEKAAQGTLSGSGFFESGQRDTTIANPCITSASVVLTTLTSNPGPVVVQYITLQPQVGFTVHLTAPTTMRASFNYIILLGELF
ncbi:hypothetical protein KDA_38520 [Dictyobacter alpinus]|uniref:Uncharacterized protein n=1 Tax=Dictyobacter alpinus TaxID=2014873 RepID=A0A402BAE7_9CHLR|nr:hypothetical protein [Dictyobacter alpinus]GCE28368.1 hypothetical protein KDA_38520 [Dictyobacter alpinus]